MPIRAETVNAGGTAYADIRVGTGHGIHQGTIGAAIPTDADGYVAPGTPVTDTGAAIPVGGTAFGVVGPEAVRTNGAATVGNLILTGALNRDMIEDNLGRALTVDEVTGLANGNFKLV